MYCMYMTAIVFADLDIAPCVHRQFLLKKKSVKVHFIYCFGLCGFN